MPFQAFKKNTNLRLQTNGWDIASDDIIAVLDSAVTEFYSSLDPTMISSKEVNVAHSKTHNPPLTHPRFYLDKVTDKIYITGNNYEYDRYAWEFSHELCHHIVQMPQPAKYDQFGWFEESLCELASNYVPYKMSEAWKLNPPFPHWQPYHSAFKANADSYLKAEKYKITKPFQEWLHDNISDLQNDRYKREENRIVAIHLFPIFYENQILWQTIQYLSKIVVTKEMNLRHYIDAWEKILPYELKKKFFTIRNLLFGKKKKSPPKWKSKTKKKKHLAEKKPNKTDNLEK